MCPVLFEFVLNSLLQESPRFKFDTKLGMPASNLKPCLITKCFSGTCVRYAVLANAGLACASICQGRLLRLWFWKAWRLSLASNRREREAREAVREAISRVLNLSCEDGYHRLKAFQTWARSVATAHCSWERVEVGRLAVGVCIYMHISSHFPGI